MNFETALSKLRPGSAWSLKTYNYEDVVWLDQNTSKPTLTEIEEKIAELAIPEPLRLLRVKRNELLASSDWRATIDYQGTNQDEWLAYRQALRDLPATADPKLENGGLTNVTWPEKPE